MKAIFTATFIIAMTVLLLTPMQSFAQSGTLVVYASGPTLDQVIGADTASNGTQKHSTYQLVSVDTTYLFDATITSRSGINIIGVPNSNGKLPCIQPDVLSDNSIPSTFFAFNGQGTRVRVANIYFLGTAINNTHGYGVALSLLADSISLTADNLVFDDMSGDAFSYQANWVNLYITNCKMRNSINSTGDYYEGEFIRNQNGAGAFKTDTIMIRYCTLNCVAAYVCAATGGITNYFEFSHSDVINTLKNPFFIDRSVNAKINNNIFYNAFAIGQTPTEYNGVWDSFDFGLPSIITMGPLDSTTASDLLGHASTGAGDPAAEALRKVEVKNNVYFWSSALTDFYTTWDDTAHVDSIIAPVWMNSRTMNMFSDKTSWPGFVESGNQNVDPQFGTSIDASLNAGTGYAQGLLGYIAAVRGGTGTTETYGCQITDVPQPEPLDWTPAWPLPEASDLAYSNTSLKTGATDGKAIGDPGWFTNGYTTGIVSGAQIPGKFTLYNAYPNPFNPSTNIKFTIAQAGVVSLKIFNSLGQVVKTVVANEYKSKGDYEMNVDMSNLSSGVYFYRLQQGNNALTKKMILMK